MATQSMKAGEQLLNTIDDDNDILDLTEEIQSDDDQEIVDLRDIVFDDDDIKMKVSNANSPPFSIKDKPSLKDDDWLNGKEDLIDLSDAIEADDAVEREMSATDDEDIIDLSDAIKADGTITPETSVTDNNYDDDELNLDELLNIPEKQIDSSRMMETPRSPVFQNESPVLFENPDINELSPDSKWPIDIEPMASADNISLADEIDGIKSRSTDPELPDFPPPTDENRPNHFWEDRDIDLLDAVGLNLTDSAKSSDIPSPLETELFLDDIGVEVDSDGPKISFNSEDTVLPTVTVHEPPVDDAELLAKLSDDQIEAALERVIHRLFREKIETALETTVSRIVHEEIQHIKQLLMDDTEKSES